MAGVLLRGSGALRQRVTSGVAFDQAQRCLGRPAGSNQPRRPPGARVARSRRGHPGGGGRHGQREGAEGVALERIEVGAGNGHGHHTGGKQGVAGLAAVASRSPGGPRPQAPRDVQHGPHMVMQQAAGIVEEGGRMDQRVHRDATTEVAPARVPTYRRSRGETTREMRRTPRNGAATAPSPGSRREPIAQPGPPANQFRQDGQGDQHTDGTGEGRRRGSAPAAA